MQLFYSSPDSLAGTFLLYKERSFSVKLVFCLGFTKAVGALIFGFTGRKIICYSKDSLRRKSSKGTFAA
ncbi:hypothetical protein DBR11_18660 [Pedobacter sp. HMWF019]|nr:hypothetical protein DBR11_18660 [Pedobacter sp. HMWF019]